MRLNADRDEDQRRDDRDALDDDASEPGDDQWDSGDDDGWDPGDDRVYWRRRFFILCAGVAALGVCAWLFPGAHQAKPRTAAAQASSSALAKGPSLPPAAYGSAYPQPTPSPSARPTPSPSAGSPKASATKTTKKASAKKKLKKQKVSTVYRPNPVPSGAKGNGSQAKCAPADIVLSLFTSQSSYAAGTRPQFSVYAVATSGPPCTLPYGAGSVQVVVTRQGRVVWDSGACKPAAAKPARFTRGVPRVLTMIWNPKAPKPAGCAGSLPAGATGTLNAVAMSHGQTSPVHTFTVRGLAPEGGLQGVAHVFHLGDLDR